MALINCPECGKENVSDSAEACPNCGYGIKAYFDNIKEQERQKQVQEIRLSSISMPKEPEKEKQWVYFSIVFGVLGLIGAFASVFAIVVAIGLIAFFMHARETNYKIAYEKYDRAKQNFEKYKQEELIKQEIKQEEERNKLKCPLCGSTNVVRITTASRVVSVATVGVASSKIGKQYECKNCKHKF